MLIQDRIQLIIKANNCEYNLDETTYTTEYSSFQVRIVMRHATSAELTTQGLTISPSELDIHMFAHVFDYRAIALT